METTKEIKVTSTGKVVFKQAEYLSPIGLVRVYVVRHDDGTYTTFVQDKDAIKVLATGTDRKRGEAYARGFLRAINWVQTGG